MAKPILILLALDPSSVLQLMERALKAAGYKVAIAHDRKGLDTSLQEAIPELVLIGETFCGEKGIDLSAEMLDRFPTLPILLYVEKEKADTARAVLKAGLSGYLVPPLHTDDIVEAVKHSLRRAGHRASARTSAHAPGLTGRRGSVRSRSGSRAR